MRMFEADERRNGALDFEVDLFVNEQQAWKALVIA